MVSEQRPDELEEEQELIPSSTKSMTPVDAVEPTAPQGMSEDERNELRERAKALVGELSSVEGAKEMELIDSVTSVGIQAQRSSRPELDLLRVRVGEMLSQEGTGSDIAGSLVDLRMTLKEINPNELNNPSRLRSLTSIVPFVDRLPSPIKVLQKIAIKYEPVSRQIDVIETKLREGRMMLTRDNVELRQVYERVEEQRLPVQKNAYLGELLMAELQALIDQTDNPVKADRIRDALYNVSIRVQNLRVMDRVYDQFFVSIEMTRQNNTRLGQAVEQTLSVATNVVTVGLAIQSALIRERQVMEANARAQQFIGDLIVANAEAIKRHTEEIGEVYNNPVIAIDKIAQAHQELIEAMDLAERLKQEGIEKARVNITELSRLSEEFQQRAGALRGADKVESVEA